MDSREQQALRWRMDHILTGTKRMKLDVGDYMVRFVDGYIPPVSVERKSINDLFGTMGRGYSRFKKEIIRAKALNIELILAIEGDTDAVLRGVPRSHMQGGSVMKKLMTLWIRYGLTPMFCGDRRQMARMVRELFEAIGRDYIKAGKSSNPDVASSHSSL